MSTDCHVQALGTREAMPTVTGQLTQTVDARRSFAFSWRRNRSTSTSGSSGGGGGSEQKEGETSYQ